MGETEEAAGALDGVDAAEDAGQQGLIGRILFQGNEVPVELVQTLGALDQKFLHDFIHLTHRRILAAGGTTWGTEWGALSGEYRPGTGGVENGRSVGQTVGRSDHPEMRVIR